MKWFSSNINILVIFSALFAVACGPTTTSGDVDADWPVPDSWDTDMADTIGDIFPDTGPCPEGFTRCGDSCVDLQTDPMNCGECGNQCTEGRTCFGGECMCREGLTVCGGYCVNTSADPENCGGCGIVCEEGWVCSAGRCSLVCDEGLTNCGGACVDIMSDLSNCGGCGIECQREEGADPACDGGVCGYTCLPNRWDLDEEPGCEYECIFVTDSEVCNGVDDNCNGFIDEDFDCTLGSEVECLTSCGSIGSGVCTYLCELPTGELCRAPDETCNGLDDDCDGAADNGFDCVMGETVSCLTGCGSSGTGICTSTCSVPPVTECTPPDETCNGLDDDCDGACDNGFDCCLGDAGEACMNPVGVAGTMDCMAGCEWSACCATAETCGNGYDDDCNGTADDGCAVCGNCTTEWPEHCDDCNADETDACKSTCVHVWENANQLYCNGSCSWAGSSGCDQADADIFCKLKMRNPLSTASSFSTTTALSEEGFSCPGYGRNIGSFPAYGVTRDVWYQTTSIRANHGAGTVVYNITCTNP